MRKSLGLTPTAQIELNDYIGLLNQHPGTLSEDAGTRERMFIDLFMRHMVTVGQMVETFAVTIETANTFDVYESFVPTLESSFRVSPLWSTPLQFGLTSFQNNDGLVGIAIVAKYTDAITVKIVGTEGFAELMETKMTALLETYSDKMIVEVERRKQPNVTPE